MGYNKPGKFCLFLLIILSFSGCFRYSFTGTSIPENVNSIYIPFFANQASGAVSNLSDLLNEALIDRFINQTGLQLSDSRATADAILEGSIVSYSNEAFSITGNEQTSLNEVTIGVRATFQYTDQDEPEWTSSFTGAATYDTNENPLQGELNAAQEALDLIANNMFNDAVSNW